MGGIIGTVVALLLSCTMTLVAGLPGLNAQNAATGSTTSDENELKQHP
jgi:hypothetical protein